MAADELDFSRVETYPFGQRRNLVSVDNFRRPPDDPAAAMPLLSSLPDVLAARNLMRLARATADARRAGRGVVFALGGHVAKTGAGLHLIPLLAEGLVTHLAVNGAFLIHDYELGRFGATSEDVAANLPEGRFGLVEETGAEMNEIVRRAAEAGEPPGLLAGKAVAERGDFADASVLAAAAAAGAGVTVHAAIGSDIIHQHPAADGRSWGEAGLADFRRLAAALKSLDDGGVYANVGSAVLLPEVFVKALNVVRHLDPPVKNFTAANLDMIQHYRPAQNVLARPTAGEGQALAITGAHEITVPLLSAAARVFAAE